MKKHVYENLAQYNDNKFLNSLKKLNEEFNFNKKDGKVDKKDDKVDKKKPVKKDQDPLEAQKEKDQTDAVKAGKDVVKKTIENFNRFKSAAGGKIGAYKKFWDNQQKALQTLQAKDSRIKSAYNMYDSNFAVVLNNEGTISIIKANLEEGEENPFFTVASEDIANEFKTFLGSIKSELKDIKNNYVKTEGSKKRDEEQKVKQDKLNKFLKEGKEEGKTWTKDEFKYEIDRLHKDMKENGYTKADCKKEVLKTMKDNKITIKKK